MKLIIGLGNPDTEYAFTRHNVGFLALDFLQKEWQGESFTPENKMSAAISSVRVEEEKVLLVKPLTYMNNSGTAVRTLMDFYKLLPSDIIVIHDDLDIQPGTYKLTSSSRDAGHNGVKDIIEKLGTQDFLRIRVGIGRPQNDPEQTQDISSYSFVLQKLTAAELNNLQSLFPKIKEEIMLAIGK